MSNQGSNQNINVSLIDQINSTKGTGEISKTKLETDEKVLARVTDGIYRLPGSALRELISNAYDADADNVTIDTDVPRFESMTIRDDGNGMSIDTLVNLIGHIGGSVKRNEQGKKLEVTDAQDSTLSPNKKRKLIGKIGIGLFSVAQLTRDFEIITKQECNDFYLKARVKLFNYSDEYIREQESKSTPERGASFETGDVEIWTESTKNISAHGTDIILRNIKKSASDQLKSCDIWGQEAAETSSSAETDDFLNSGRSETPSFHVGFLSGSGGYEYFDIGQDRQPQLPWDENDPDDIKFSKLYDGVLSLTKNTVSPKLQIVLDNYLHMIWILGLSVPLDYINGHPFNMSLSDIPDCYKISNKLKGQASKIEFDDKDSALSELIPFTTKSHNVGFNVVIDGVKLFRPIKVRGLPDGRSVVKKPILFLGSFTPDLSSMNVHDSAGKLSFDAYILWSPKIIPRDHNGVLVRLHNASGIMFDETFMKHQVAEHTIKSQLTIEIFVHEGLDSALNIDRESFNISHPHYQIVMLWLHQAIRQVVNRFKAIKKELAVANRNEGRSDLLQNLAKSVDNSLAARGEDPTEKPSLYIFDKKDSTNNELPFDSFNISKRDYLDATGLSNASTEKSYKIETKTEALLQVLDSYHLLGNLSPDQQKSLVFDLLKIISIEG